MTYCLKVTLNLVYVAVQIRVLRTSVVVEGRLEVVASCKALAGILEAAVRKIEVVRKSAVAVVAVVAVRQRLVWVVEAHGE